MGVPPDGAFHANVGVIDIPDAPPVGAVSATVPVEATIVVKLDVV